MKRRKFLTLSVATALTLPMMAMATDYRTEKPAAWTAKKVDDAVKALYGDVTLIESSDVIVKAPKVATGAVPITIQTSIKAKSVSLFQDANPESAVATWSISEGAIVDYRLKIKLRQTEKPAVVSVVVEGMDGKFYTAHTLVTVAGATCEG
jgi:sulfur-oxidizing protein SoxY